MTSTLEALRITYDLAQHSALGLYEARRDHLMGVYFAQEKALDEVSLLMERIQNGESPC